MQSCSISNEVTRSISQQQILLILQPFLIREGRNVITLVTENAKYTPPEYISMGNSLSCSEAVCCQESLGYPRYDNFVVIPAFLSLSSFYTTGICGPASLLGYPARNSSMTLQIDLSLIKSEDADLRAGV